MGVFKVYGGEWHGVAREVPAATSPGEGWIGATAPISESLAPDGPVFFCRINLCATSIAKRRLFRLVGEVEQPSPHKLATLEMGGNGPSRPGWEFRGFLQPESA